jgi:hypothetical protein
MIGDRYAARRLESVFPAAVVFILALIPAVVSAAQHTITSLPYTCSVDYDTLVLSGNLSATGSGISIRAHNVYLRGRGDTIVFNTSGMDNAYGIEFEGWDTYNVKVDSLTIIQNSSSGSNNLGIRLNALHDIKVYDCNVHMKGFDCMGMYHPSTAIRSYNVEVRGGNWTSFVNAFSNRCQNPAAVMNLGYQDDSQGDYGYWVHNVVVDSCPHTGILVWGKAYVDSNTLYGNAHNDAYTRPSGNTCLSADNPYMVGLAEALPGSRVIHNTIRARTSYEGARGIMVENGVGTVEDPIVVAYNDVRVTNGPSDYEGAEPAVRGIRLRAVDWGGLGALQHVHVHDNYVEVWADTLSSTTHIGSIASAFQFTAYTSDSHDNMFYNNTFIAMGDTQGGFGDNGGKVYAVAPEILNTEPYNNVSYDNRLVSNGTCLSLGAWNGGTSEWLSVADTLEWLEPKFRNIHGYRGIVGIGSGGLDCLDNILRDMVYIGGTDSDMAYFDIGGDKEIFHQKTLRVYVYGNNDLPVRDAHVEAVNNYGVTVLSATTNAFGYVEEIVTYDYDRWIGPTHYDSVYNDFSIEAMKGDDSSSIDYFVDAFSAPPVLILSGTSGEDPPDDVTPPGRTEDLEGVPGPDHGRVVLTWTAPGDDEFIGTADHYVVKYSESPITESNWGAAMTLPDPPAPQEAGGAEEVTAGGLTEGETYYFGLKAFDEAGNSSPLSNIAVAFASGIAVPTPYETLIDQGNASVEVISLAIDSYQPVYYEFALDTLDYFPNARIEVDLAADSTASAIFDGLSEELVYFWRCRAMASDMSDSSDWSPETSFNIVVGVTGELSASNCLYPQQGQMVETDRPTFVVEYVPGVPQIYFQVDEEPGFGSPLESGAVPAALNANTEWPIPQQLLNGTMYFWRISPNDSVWTAPISFAVSLDIHSYPNPFRVSDGHSGITFTNLPPDCRLIIATVAGEIVRKVDGVGPNDWVWDVRNDNGRDVVSGVYLYVVEYAGGSAHDKVMIIR